MRGKVSPLITMPKPTRNTEPIKIYLTPAAKSGLLKLAADMGFTYNGDPSISRLVNFFGEFLNEGVDINK